jgi:hypothetical protein
VGCLLASLSAAAGKSDDTSPPAVACYHTQQRTFFVLCQVPAYLVCTASRGVTWANGSLPVPAHSCATDGCGVSVYQSILHSVVVVVPGGVRSSLRNQSRDLLHDDTSSPPPSHNPTPPFLYPPPRTTPHTPMPSSARRVQPRILPPTRFALMTEVFLVVPAATATVASYLQIMLAELRIKAVTGLMITVETHAGTVSLLSISPTFRRRMRAWSFGSCCTSVPTYC